jgi:hypothetical protein
MYRHVNIHHGLIGIGGFPALDYQLHDEHGQPVTISYRGTVWIEGNRIVIGDPQRDIHLYEYCLADHPTESSAQFACGYDWAKKQTRCAWPNGRSESFRYGWEQAWKERDPVGFRKRMWLEIDGVVMSEQAAKRRRQRAA